MADVISATFLIPQKVGVPLMMEFLNDALRMAVVDRDEWEAGIAANWKRTGVYLLFGPAVEEAAGRYSVYVGKAAPGSIDQRITNHVKNREGWDRALLVTRTTQTGFNSTSVGWLEGRLYQVLSASPFAEVANATTPGDDTITDWDREALERVVTLIRSVMRVLGFRSDPPSPDRPQPPGGGEVLAESGFDVDLMHQVVSLVHPGEWTTYGDVAEAVGSHPRGIGAHIRHCADDAPEWRVLNRRGESQPGFTWTTRPHAGSQLDVLLEEGLYTLEDGRADPESRVDAAELTRRQNSEPGGS